MQRFNLKDPVCGMTVTEKSFYHVEHEGKVYRFCGAGCKQRFMAKNGLRSVGAGATNLALPTSVATQHRPKWRSGGILFLALFAALLFAGRWLAMA